MSIEQKTATLEKTIESTRVLLDLIKALPEPDSCFTLMGNPVITYQEQAPFLIAVQSLLGVGWKVFDSRASLNSYKVELIKAKFILTISIYLENGIEEIIKEVCNFEFA